LYLINAFYFVDNFTRDAAFMGVIADLSGLFKWLSFIIMVLIFLHQFWL